MLQTFLLSLEATVACDGGSASAPPTLLSGVGCTGAWGSLEVTVATVVEEGKGKGSMEWMDETATDTGPCNSSTTIAQIGHRGYNIQQ